jgi:hypothetical protein
VSTPKTPNPDAPATQGSLNGLANEVDALRLQLRPLGALQARVDELAATLAQVVDNLATSGRRPDPVRPVSWIAHSRDLPETTRRLEELAGWVGQVYLRYPVAARELPDCWLWHPDIVEELAWLHQAWEAAYDPNTGTVAAAADWHDRYRPGAVSRIRASNRVCSLENHQQPESGVTTTAPSVGSLPQIAHWWTCVRDQKPPVPTQADLDAAAVRLRTRK